MKITMDRAMTEDCMIERTKNQMKEFKEIYTDNDLLRIFRDATKTEDLSLNYKIIRCNLSAFPGGYFETDETHYMVDMLLEGFREFVKLHFFISQSGEVNTSKYCVPSNDCDRWMDMYSITHYREA